MSRMTLRLLILSLLTPLSAAAGPDNSQTQSSHSIPPAVPAAVDVAHADPLESRIAGLESEIEWLRKNRTAPVQPNIDALATIDRQLTCRERGSGGLFFGVEACFLRPYLSGARSSSFGTGGKWIDPSYGTATRLNLGYENDSGFGLRTSYFSMNHGMDLASNFGTRTVGLNMDVVDLEATLENQLRHWDLGVSGGVRYGDLSFTGDGAVIFPGQLAFEGFGPTASLSATRQLSDSGFTLFGNLRGSLLIGEIHNNHPARGLSLGEVEDELMQVIDHQMGVAWKRTVFQRAQLEIRAAWETQFWLNDTIADDTYGIGSNLALSGPTIGIQLKY